MSYPAHIIHGSVATSARASHVREMIEQVLFTMPGERVMYPDFGVGLERLLFESTGSEITVATQSLVSAALHRWLGDVIAVNDVKVTVSESTLSVEVAYQLLDNRKHQRELFKL